MAKFGLMRLQNWFKLMVRLARLWPICHIKHVFGQTNDPQSCTVSLYNRFFSVWNHSFNNNSLTKNIWMRGRLKSRFFENRELYWSNLTQNSNLGRESFVQKSGVRIPVGEGQIFCHFSFFLYLFHFVHKKLNIKTYTTFFVY